jgi:hypothetical protein
MDFTNQSACPFCNSNKTKIILAKDHAMAIYDGFSVTPGHSLIIPKRHIDFTDKSCIVVSVIIDASNFHMSFRKLTAFLIDQARSPYLVDRIIAGLKVIYQ